MAKNKQIGKTGQFPRGMIAPDDEGQLAFAVGIIDGRIYIHFHKPMDWIGFDAESARDLATKLAKFADHLEPPV